VSEKMLMAGDGSRDETQKLHKKWLKHQAFMAELAQNKEWLDKIERVSTVLATLFDSQESVPLILAYLFTFQLNWNISRLTLRRALDLGTCLRVT